MPQVWYKKEISRLEKKNRKLQQDNEKKQKQIDTLKSENAGLKNKLKQMAEKKKAKKPKFSENYSIEGQEKKKGIQKRKTSPGRTPKEKKIHTVNEEKHIYPEGVSQEKCIISHSRYVIHIRSGKKHIVRYHLYKLPWGEAAQLPGVMPRGEYGMEIAIILAFLVFFVENSIDQARKNIAFFTGVHLSRSQADALLNQLGNLWEPELEKITTLLTLAYLVHIDETGWKIGTENNYAWIFTSLAHTVLLYGKSRGEETLEEVLSREFEGIAITDFFSTYEKYFKNQQKCWAHLLRTAIKLMLLQPEKKEYAQFFNRLHRIFRDAKNVQKDESLTEEQKTKNVTALQRRIRNACPRHKEKIPKEAEPNLRDFLNLQKRLIRYMDSLFTFVLRPDVEPTNNRAERGFRKTARARNNYQTSKTDRGARRRSVIASVLTSLQQNLPEFSLEAVIAEVTTWRTEGQSLFDRQLQLARASPG